MESVQSALDKSPTPPMDAVGAILDILEPYTPNDRKAIIAGVVVVLKDMRK